MFLLPGSSAPTFRMAVSVNMQKLDKTTYDQNAGTIPGGKVSRSVLSILLSHEFFRELKPDGDCPGLLFVSILIARLLALCDIAI